MAKPDLKSILGGSPKKAPAKAPPDDPDMAQEPQEAELGLESPVEEAVEAPAAAGGGDLTPMMLDYHGGDQSCGNCTMYTPPATCSRWPDPVEESGWCKGFSPADQGSPEGDLGGLEGGLPPELGV